MSLCGFPKNNQTHMWCIQVDRTKIEREARDREELLFTQEKKNYAKREVTAVHEGNGKHSRLTIALFLFHSRSAASRPFARCVITLTSQYAWKCSRKCFGSFGFHLVERFTSKLFIYCCSFASFFLHLVAILHVFFHLGHSAEQQLNDTSEQSKKIEKKNREKKVKKLYFEISFIEEKRIESVWTKDRSSERMREREEKHQMLRECAGARKRCLVITR